MSDWHRTAQILAVALLGAAVAVIVALTLARDYDADVTASDSPSPREIASDAPTIGPRSEKPLDEARDVLLDKQPIDVLVLGDSSGNNAYEWPVEWARALTSHRTVTIWQWDPDLEQFAAAPLRPPSSGPDFTVWNLSQPNVAAAYGAEHLDAVRAEPDLVLLNYGHFNTPRDIGPQLDGVLAAMRQRWGDVPTVLTLQNPTTDPRASDHADTVAHLRRVWAPEHDTPTIDIERAFRAAGPLDTLLLEGTNPNAAGTLVWTQEVIDALTPGATVPES